MSETTQKDSSTTVEQLKQVVTEFVAERKWQQFHSPKNLSMALAIEAAELMEHFQWISMEDSRQVCDDSQKCREVADEMSDVLCYLLAMANELEIDLTESLQAKMVKNRQKYPSDVFKGKYGKEDLD